MRTDSRSPSDQEGHHPEQPNWAKVSAVVHRLTLKGAATHDAEDLAQEALLATWNRWATRPAGLQSCVAYAICVVHRARGHQQKAASRIPTVSLPKTVADTRPPSAPDERWRGLPRSKIPELIERLAALVTPKQRHVLELHFRQGHATSEIASRTRWRADDVDRTIEAILQRARKNVREVVERDSL